MERLRHIREQAGYSQQDLADGSGVSQHTISELELGRRRPQGRTLRKLAKVLGVEVPDLRGHPDSPGAEAPPSQQLTLNGVLAEERRTPSRAELNAVETLEAFCSQLDEFLARVDIADDRNRALVGLQEYNVRIIATLTLPLMEKESTLHLALPAAERLVDLARRFKIAEDTRNVIDMVEHLAAR